MITLNIPSDFNVISFPDGQQDIVLKNAIYVNADTHVRLRSRFNSFLDLELILAATAAVKRCGVNIIDLDIPYLLGARCDRKFQSGGTSYLKDVISPIINSQKYRKVIVYDVHNAAVADACIDNLECVSNHGLVQTFFGSVIHKESVIVSPDEGASKKIWKLMESLSIEAPVVQCSKKRDEKGNIVSVDVGNVCDFRGKNVIIIDDICDGGRTFIEIAKIIQQRNPGEMTLIVSHGIFSNGFTELEKYFTHIVCTNSVKDIDHPLVKQYPII